jgi:23S rRNA (guanosine2251-2'-O)-methyltransferase
LASSNASGTERLDRIYGLHAVEAAWVAGRPVRRLYVQKGSRNARLHVLREMLEQGGVPVSEVDRALIDRWTRGGIHQGVVAEVASDGKGGPACAGGDLEAWFQAPDRHSLLLALDGIQDPRNLGACLRSAAAFGVSGIMLPRHRAAPLNATAVKSASGGADRVPCRTVPNLVRCLEQARRSGFWVLGLDHRGKRGLHEWLFDRPTVLVAGGEGGGIKRLTRESCDEILRIPLSPGMDSLNVSVAVAIALYEIRRQSAFQEQLGLSRESESEAPSS